MEISGVRTMGSAGAEVEAEREKTDVSRPNELDRRYPPGVRDVFLTGPINISHGECSQLRIGLDRCLPDDTFETISLLDEAQNLGITGIGVGDLVERVINGMLAQWGSRPEIEPPAEHMWECALMAAHKHLWRNSNLRKRILLAMVTCQGGREKSPTDLIKAILPNRPPDTASLQAVIAELRAYGCSQEEIALAWKKMLGLRFARGFGTHDIFVWWRDLKIGDGCVGRDVTEGVNRQCVMRDLRTLIEKGVYDAIQPDSIGLIFVDASFLTMVERICSLCCPKWRHSPLVSEAVERMFVICLSRGNVARAFQMFAQFGSYFGLCHRDSSDNIDKDSVTSALNRIIHEAIEQASKDNEYGIACALAMQVGCVRDVIRVKHFQAQAARRGQKIALNFGFYVRTKNTTAGRH